MATTWTVEKVVSDPVAFELEQSLLARFADEGDAGYLHYLGQRQDHVIAANPSMWESASNAYALDYLRTHGLSRRHHLLDFGCGTVSAGRHLIRFLDPQHYVGADISEKSIDVAWGMLRQRQDLLAKGPVLHTLRGADVSVLNGLSFDVVWAQSVLTQSSPAIVKFVLGTLRPLTKPSGSVFANFNHIETGVTQTQVRHWAYSTQFIREAAAEVGFVSEIMKDWAHPFDYLNPGKGSMASGDTMVRLTPR